MNFCVVVNISLTIRKIYSLRKLPRKSVENYYYHNAEKNSLVCQKQSLLVLVLFKFIAQEYGTEVPFEPLTPGMECWGCVCSSFPGELLVIPVWIFFSCTSLDRGGRVVVQANTSEEQLGMFLPWIENGFDEPGAFSCPFLCDF